jgi:hypothetical protein
MRPWAVVTSGTLTVGSVSDGDSVAVWMSGIKVDHTVSGGEDTEAARDALLTLLQASDISATFAASGTDAITVTPTALGDVYNVEALGQTTWAASTSVYAVQIDEATYRIELQISSKALTPMDGASSLMARVFATTDLPSVQAIRDLFGLRIDVGNPINLDRLVGPDWESREVVDIEVTTLSLETEAADTLTQIIASIEARSDLATLETISLDVSES